MLPLLNLFIFCSKCVFKEKQGRSLTKTFSFPESSLREKELKCTMMILENYFEFLSPFYTYRSSNVITVEKWNYLAC